MPISGIDPTDSDDASMEYESIIWDVKRRVIKNFKYLPKTTGQDAIALASVQALRILATGIPHLGVMCIMKDEVAELREKYFKWFETAKIPKKFRDGLRESAAREFDLLEEVAMPGEEDE